MTREGTQYERERGQLKGRENEFMLLTDHDLWLTMTMSVVVLYVLIYTHE